MKKSTKIFIFIIVGILLAAVLGFLIWSQQTYKPTKELHQLVTTEDYTQTEDGYVFQTERPTQLGIILYPGAKVEPLAYGYLAERLSSAGYLVIIPKMRLNMAIFETEKAKQIISIHADVPRWVVGGHSLGGVAAADFVANYPEKIAGLLLLASYPSDNVDFSMGTLNTLSIYAENDKVSTPEDILNKQSSLSSTALLHEIAGGNHAGFGMYGDQADDGVATISNIDQQNRIIKQTKKWLAKIDGEELP